VSDRRTWLARLLDALYRWAESGWSGPAAGTWALLQSSVVPGPADAVFFPLGLADPRRVFPLAAWSATFASVGGVLAYLLGASATSGGTYFLDAIGVSANTLAAMTNAFARYGWMLVYFGAFGPVSTKLVCFTAGMLAMPFLPFLAAISAGRWTRFLALAVILHAGGARLRAWVERKSGRQASGGVLTE
jgi:membrane protein YqaA with SNARE-associated domain